MGAALTRLALSTVTGLDPAGLQIDRTCHRCGGQHGPPRCAAAGLQVSVSHAGEVVAVALAARPVGLDVEPETSAAKAGAAADLVIASSERSAARRSPTELLQRWVVKEAVLKASGDGLIVPMTDLVVARGRGGSDQWGVRCWKGRPDLVGRVRIAPVRRWPGHLAAVALIEESPSPDALAVDVSRLLA